MSVDLIEHNPAYKKPALLVLNACSEGVSSRLELEDAVAGSWDAKWRQSPSSITDILVRAKALHEELTLNGEPCDASLEELQLDLSVPEDAEWSSSITLTALGRQIIDDYAPSATIAALYSEKPHYAEVFTAAVAACAGEAGCSRQELEAAINAWPQLKPDPQTKQTKVYAQYFIDALETAGAIQWDGSWKATPEGRSLLAS